MLSKFYHAIRTCFGPTSAQNRRRWSRRKRCTLLTIQELDDDLSSVGNSKWAVSRDISQMGIGFVTKETVSFNYVRVTIVEDNYSAIGIIRHARLLDDQDQYFVGVEFLDDYACHER
jgi:hypothetical protein